MLRQFDTQAGELVWHRDGGRFVPRPTAESAADVHVVLAVTAAIVVVSRRQTRGPHAWRTRRPVRARECADVQDRRATSDYADVPGRESTSIARQLRT